MTATVYSLPSDLDEVVEILRASRPADAVQVHPELRDRITGLLVDLSASHGGRRRDLLLGLEVIVSRSMPRSRALLLRRNTTPPPGMAPTLEPVAMIDLDGGVS